MNKSHLFLFAGCAFYVVLAQRTSVHLYGDMMVWYHMFVIFVMYCMLPVPVKGRMLIMDGTF